MSGDIPNLGSGSTEHSSSSSMENSSSRDPFFVHPADNPNDVLCSPPLNGDNYASWKRGMMRALHVKNKIGFVDGSISKPTDKSQMDEWMRADDLVTGWIHAAILPGIKDSVSYASTTTILWKDLENRLRIVSAPSQSRVYLHHRDISQVTPWLSERDMASEPDMSSWTDLLHSSNTLLEQAAPSAQFPPLKRNLDQLETLSKKLKSKTVRTEVPA